jgi:hypothetical protein
MSLGQATTSEAQAGVEQSSSDSLVTSDGVGQVCDVGVDDFAYFGHRVDEGNLGCKEGIRGDLDQFGGGEIGDDDRGPGLVDFLVYLPDGFLGGVTANAENDAVRAERVADREAFPEELRVPDEFAVCFLDQG